MKTKINIKKAILWGFVVIIIQMLISNLFYMNPIVAKINERFVGHPSLKTFDFIGGLVNWIMLTMVFGIILMIIWIILYRYTYIIIPGKGWIKGLIFGFILGLIKSVPEAFNQFMVINYPIPLIMVQLINTLLGLTIFGFLLGFFYSKFKVIEEV